MRFTKEEVAYMLEADSLPNPDKTKKRKSTAKTGVRVIKNTPITLHNRKIKMPKEVNMLLGPNYQLSVVLFFLLVMNIMLMQL